MLKRLDFGILYSQRRKTERSIFGKYRKEMKLMKDKAPPRPAVKKNNPPPAQPPRPQVQQATIETVKNDGKPQLIRQQNVQEKEELEVVELK